MSTESRPSIAPIDEIFGQLLPALAEAERASEETATRFVSPRPGILKEASARRHQFVFGRRGVGKSTLLRRVAVDCAAKGMEVVSVDIETLRRRPPADVLFELLRALLTHFQTRLRAGSRRHFLRRRALLRQLGEAIDGIDVELEEPQSSVRTSVVQRSRSRGSARHWGAGGDASLAARRGGARAGVRLGGELAAREAQDETAEARSEAQFVRTKMDHLAELVLRVRGLLGQAEAEQPVPTLVVLDDFYHLPREDQPEVLAYLHQVVKGFDIHLKICGVRHRLNPFVDGDPPLGMQPEHDAGTLSLDITLERFGIAKDFLELVVSGICEPFGMDLEDLVTEEGRERLVLASGGVARDYLSLLRRALRSCMERPADIPNTRNRVEGEDVVRASVALYEQKQEDLKQDAGDEADSLRSRLSEIVRFCADLHRTHILLVETTKLQEETWGSEVEALTDLRLLNRIDTLSTKSAGAHSDRMYAAFTLDLSIWTTRPAGQIAPVRFWEPSGRDQLRELAQVYTPELAQIEMGPSR
jgi:Cdc6-like AAA superfamily ATPase